MAICRAQPPSAEAHGTVNILLANDSGLVAVTDSMLSNPTGQVGRGQKLFKIDDHTICTIAGFYMDAGPAFGSGRSFLAYTVVPDIIDAYIRERPFLPTIDLDSKLRTLVNAFTFSLELIANLDKAAGIDRTLQKSEITLAGYNGGAIEIARVDLVPSSAQGDIYYVPQYYPVLKVGKKLSYSVAGISDVADTVLSHPREHVGNDPILELLDDSVTKDGGASLTVEDMREIADKLELMTSQKHRIEVGGLRQVAVLANGGIAKFDVGSDQSHTAPPGMVFDQMMDPTIRNSGKISPSFGISAIHGRAVLVIRGSISDVIQPLDNVLFVGTTFTHCMLTYDGSPMALFDKGNVVKDSELRIGPQVKADNPFILQLKADHPELFHPK
jgi:hypothetical protein